MLEEHRLNVTRDTYLHPLRFRVHGSANVDVFVCQDNNSANILAFVDPDDPVSEWPVEEQLTIKDLA